MPATAASITQLNRMILRIVITLGPSGPRQGELVAKEYLTNRGGTVTEVTGQYCEIELASTLEK